MKVLFWVSPTTDMCWPFQKSWWLRDSVPNVARALSEAERVDDAAVCVSADLLRCFEASGGHLEGRVVPLTQRELLNDYRLNALEARKRFQATGEMSPYYDHLDRLFVSKMGADYRPDVIVSFDESPFLRRRYPDAVHLAFEYSVFSRAPYPSLYCFDPLSGGNGFRFTYAAHADRLNALPAKPAARQALSALRREVLRTFSANEAVGAYFAGLRGRCERILLMPLGFENFFNTLVRGNYPGQFEFVQHVLEVAGPGTRVVVTQHPTIHAIRPERLVELKKLHANLEYEDWYGSVPSFSQVALAYVDGCVTGSSSVAYQAAFLGKHVILPDGFCPGLADAASLTSLGDVWRRPPKDRDNFFAWVLRHAAVDMGEAGSYFKRALPVFRQMRGKSVDEAIALWPAVFGEDELGGRVQAWIEKTVRPFAETLAGIVPKAVDGDMSVAAFRQAKDAAVRQREEELKRQMADLRSERDQALRRGERREEELQALKASFSYRLGRLMTWPLRQFP